MKRLSAQKKYFYPYVEGFLEERGYGRIDTSDTFQKKTAHGFQNIYFEWNQNHGTESSVKLWLTIRNNLIEEIKAKLAPENTEPDKRTLFFSPMDIKELLSQENKEELFFLREFGLDGVDESKIGPLDFHQRFLVQHNQVYGDVIDFFKDESIERWVNGFQRLMEDWGMNFLDQLKTDRGIHHFLNDQILSEGYQFVAPTFKVLNTMTCGLIAAWFTNLSDFENVYSFWEEKFADEERHQFMWEIRSLRGLLEEDAT